MSKPKINLILVSYLNTLPFLEGFNNNPDHSFNLIFKTPSEGAKSFFNNEASIALIPIGSLIHKNDYSICTEYCIGCDGAVRTVGVFSDCPMEDIERVYLDEDSRTSVLLVKVLFENLGLTNIKWIHGLPERNEDIAERSGILAIGDKVFDYEGKWSHFSDLGSLWKKTFELPFAFAVFVAKDDIKPELLEELNTILKIGINGIPSMKFPEGHQIKDLPSYFKKNISYHLDGNKKKAIQLFISEVERLEL